MGSMGCGSLSLVFIRIVSVDLHIVLLYNRKTNGLNNIILELILRNEKNMKTINIITKVIKIVIFIIYIKTIII